MTSRSHNTNRRQRAWVSHGGSAATYWNVCCLMALLVGTVSFQDPHDVPDKMPLVPASGHRQSTEVRADTTSWTDSTESANDLRPDLMPYYPHTHGADARFVCPALRASAPLLPSRDWPGMEPGVFVSGHPQPDAGTSLSQEETAEETERVPLL